MIRRRPILRTAAIGGVAYAAGSHAAAKSAQQAQMEAEQNAQIAELQQQQAMQQQPASVAYQQPAPAPTEYQQPVPPPADAAPVPSSGTAPEMLEQLKQLGELRASNVLTDDEFQAAKQKILGQL